MNKQFGAVVERQGPRRPSSAGSQMSMLFDQRPAGVQSALDMHAGDSARSGLRNTTRQLQVQRHIHPRSATPGPSSFGTEHPSISQHPIQVPKPPEMHHPDQGAKEMEAYFRTQEQQHSSSSCRPRNPPQRQEPRIAPPHETSSKTRRPRRRTTDALERTKSSRLPLERTPKGFHIQDLILPLSTSIHAIIQCSRKLDMQYNSPEWSYAAEDAYSVFAEPVFEKKSMEWVIQLDDLLCRRYKRIDGPDTRCEIHEGIQRALDARKEMDDATQRDESMCQDTLRAVVEAHEHNVSRDDSDVVQHPVVETEKKTAHDDDEFDFDMEQFIDLTEEVERQILGIADGQSGEVIKSEYDDDIEDEMLMDL